MIFPVRWMANTSSAGEKMKFIIQTEGAWTESPWTHKKKAIGTVTDNLLKLQIQHGESEVWKLRKYNRNKRESM